MNLILLYQKKLSAPHNQEIAIGAIMEDGPLFLNYEITTELEIDRVY